MPNKFQTWRLLEGISQPLQKWRSNSYLEQRNLSKKMKYKICITSFKSEKQIDWRLISAHALHNLMSLKIYPKISNDSSENKGHLPKFGLKVLLENQGYFLLCLDLNLNQSLLDSEWTFDALAANFSST